MLTEQQRRANRHTAWVLVGLALFFGLTFVVKIVWLSA